MLEAKDRLSNKKVCWNRRPVRQNNNGMVYEYILTIWDIKLGDYIFPLCHSYIKKTK